MSALVQVMRAEAFKTAHKRRTVVLAALWWVLLPVLTLIVARVLQVNLGGSFLDEPGMGVADIVQALASPYGLARIALTGPAFLSPTFYIITVALLAALYIGEEKSLNMWKTTLVAQPSRLAVLWGKIAVAMLTLAGLMAGALASGILFGLIGTLFLPTHWGGEWASLVSLYGLQWINAIAAVLFASLMIYLVRNIALGIVTVFFLPALLEGLYRLWSITVGFRPLNRLNAPFQVLRLRQTLEDLPRYFFTDNLYLPARRGARDLTELFGAEARREMNDAPFAGMFGGGLTLDHSVLVMLVYATVFAVVLTWLFVRRDVD